MQLNKIYQIDAYEGMQQLEDNSVDLVLTDPPYGVRSSENWDNKDNFISNLKDWLREIRRVIRCGAIWFCAEKMLPLIFQTTNNIDLDFHRLLIWEKPAGSQFAGVAHNNIWYSIAPILVFKKSKDLLDKSKDKEWAYANLKERTVNSDKFGHPTTKPLRLIKTLVKHYSVEEDLILDPFVGTGTTALACAELNRRYIGFELQEKHFKTAKSRLTAIQKTLI